MPDAHIRVVFMSVCRLSLVCVWTTSRQPLNVYIIFIHTRARAVGVCSKIIIILGRERAKALKPSHVSTDFYFLDDNFFVRSEDGFSSSKEKRSPKTVYQEYRAMGGENVDDSTP